MAVAKLRESLLGESSRSEVFMALIVEMPKSRWESLAQSL